MKCFCFRTQSALRFLKNWWVLKKRPTLTLLLREDLFKYVYFTMLVKLVVEVEATLNRGVAYMYLVINVCQDYIFKYVLWETIKIQ